MYGIIWVQCLQKKLAYKQVPDEALRAQKLQACELAVVQGIQQNNEAVLRRFTSEMLHFSWAWGPVVVMALMDKTKAGDYRWRNAKNPLGMVRIIARRMALKCNPELLFGNDADKVLRPEERAVSTLRGPGEEATDGGDWHDEFIDRASFEACRDYDDDSQIWNELHYSLAGKKNDGLSFDWDEISRRMGFTPDQAALIKARAQGVTRVEMGKHLQWAEQKVERVWRGVGRCLEKPGMSDRARALLCGPSEKKLLASCPQCLKSQHV